MKRFAIALLSLALVTIAAPHAQQAPAAGQVDSSPLFAGITDAASLSAAVERRLTNARAALEALVSVQGRRTVANTLRPYDDIQREGQAANGLANLVRQLHPDPAIRAVAEKLALAVGALNADVTLDRRVYDALVAVDLSGAGADVQHYVRRELATYRRQGVDRDDATRERLKALRAEHARLAQEFDRNVRQGVRRFTVAPTDLIGLPADFIAAHKPGADGAITLSTEAPDLQPVMLYAASSDLRRRMVIESATVGYPANVDVLGKLLRVRSELARTLGYDTWASYDLEDRMVGSAEAAAAFIDRIVAASAKKVDADYRQLLARKRQDDPKATVVEAWDRRYYTELVRRASYQFDSQAVRPYLSYPRVRDGLFGVTRQLFGLELRPAPALPTWHSSVEPYEVFEAGRLIGRVYLDMHPRADKGGSGASSSTVRSGVAGVQTPEVVLIARFPGGASTDPGLMTHEQVVTFFHEFGHLVHALLSGRQSWAGLTRPSERDFMEAPSQMFEEWTLDPTTLATFARHYQTGEPIAPSLVRQMRRASELGRGYDVRQQMVFAGLSLSLHNRAPESVDPVAIHRELSENYLPTPWVAGTYVPASFTHLANPNYTAAYYTYMWSLVIAKDLFSRFDARNLLDPGVAKQYREKILMQGGSKPAVQLVQDFLGRPSNPSAWEAWLNYETPE